MGPWEQYQAPSKKPWEQYAEKPTATTPLAEKKAEVSLADKAKKAALETTGAGEAALNLGTGIVAKPLSDIAGLAATGYEALTGNKNPGGPAGFQKSVQQGLTYEPRSQSGKAIAEYNPLALAGKGISKVADIAGSAVGGGVGADTLRGMAGNLTREGIQQGAGFIAPALKKPIMGRLASEEASLAAEKASNATRDANVAAARQKGYVLPPSVAGVKGQLSSFFQGEAGSTKLDYGASMKNQRVSNSLIKKELGLPEDEAISKKSLSDIRDKQSAAYENVKTTVPTLKITPEFKSALQNPNSKFAKARSEFPEYFKNTEIQKLTKDLTKKDFSTDAAIEMQKVLRHDGYANLKAFDKPKQKALGEAQINAAKAIDDLIDQNLQMQAPPGVKNFQSKLASGLNDARKKIAQTYAVENALNDQTGNVSARSLAKQWDKSQTLTGGLKDVAQTAKTFEKQMRDVDKLPATASEGISNLDVGKAGVMAALGHAPLAGAMTLGRMAVKPALLSDWYQQLNIKPPTYKPGLVYTLPATLAQNPGLALGIPKPPNQDNQ